MLNMKNVEIFSSFSHSHASASCPKCHARSDAILLTKIGRKNDKEEEGAAERESETRRFSFRFRSISF